MGAWKGENELETTVKSKALQQFQEATETIVNPELKKWIEQGGKVVGYFCSYGPEEIITAAGMVPIRIRATGSTGTELADAYLSSINCSFCRHAFNMGLQGDYDFLEGLVWLNNCDHVRRIYDNWIRKVDTPFTQMMSLPKMTTDVQVEWFRDELKILKEALEKHLGITISDEKLWKAIKLHNQTRRLLRQLYELRKKDNPPITGAEALAVVVASTAMPREQFNDMLKELLEELSDAEGITDYRARLMIVAGILDDPAFIKVIEEQGGLVVTDSMCFGTRILWTDVNEGASDPLTALARYYIQDKPACPRMFDTQPQRSKFVRDMVKEFKVDGVIGERMIFCDLWTGENFMLGGDLKEEGIPFLKLDREYIMAGAGQLRTRAQAFLESMGR
ncbi:MAG: 2-hydroxyacyl-CoA dehydratase [Dehalococcoidia bacterium]|nr:MAG: 2-hydroxyacyl-CoA dehydratase [Dehalococcoidia bacterium]